MTGFSRLLLIPCLAPLLTVLVLSAANRTPVVQLKVLIWTSPALPLGAWTALAGTAGTALSGVAAVLMLPPRKRLQAERFSRGATSVDPATERVERSAPTTMPERDIREPAPTVSVPFRVIQRPARSVDVPEARSDASSTPIDDWEQDPNRDW